MKFSILHRIYINSGLKPEQNIILSEEDGHYIKRVLRLRVGDRIRAFNGRDGEFEAEIISSGLPRRLDLKPLVLIRKAAIEKPLILGLSLIKVDKMLEAISASTALGVTEIIPVIAERSQLRRINKDRALKVILESVKQSERFEPPILHDPILIKDYLKQYSSALMIFANENEPLVNSLLKIPAQLLDSAAGISLLIGPEGGFTEQELSMLQAADNTKSISLGPTVLRTEIAAVVLLAQLRLLR